MNEEVEAAEQENGIVIIAPHPDDEIIGCYEVIQKTDRPIIVLYSASTEAERRDETKLLRDHTNVKYQSFHDTVPTPLLRKTNTFYFPDPYFEVHPLHRYWGVVGESAARNGFDVIFYSTIMNTPYIHEVQYPDKKEELLSKVYPSQSDMWKYEKKYILFEGYCKWVF